MTEAEWLRCKNPNRMLDHLRGQKRARRAGLIQTVVGFLRGQASKQEPQPPVVSSRKVRLYACACCRMVWPLLNDGQSRRTVDAAEQFADGLVTKRALAAARREARRRAPAPAWHVAWEKVWAAARLAGRAAAILEARAGGDRAAFSGMRRKQCALVHEIFGNPFRPMALPVEWPAPVGQLAEAMYAGEDCAFALRDALLETGHAEFAEHFAGEGHHPKGCWVVDAILGKR